MNKRCTKCGKLKRLYDFNRCKNGRFGVSSWCKICKNEYKRGWDKSNAEYKVKYKREYQQEHKELYNSYNTDYRKKLKAQTPELSNREKKLIRKYYDLVKSLNKSVGYIGYHVDHIIPVSKGGIHHPNNMQILSAKDSMRKGNKIDFNDYKDNIIILK